MPLPSTGCRVDSTDSLLGHAAIAGQRSRLGCLSGDAKDPVERLCDVCQRGPDRIRDDVKTAAEQAGVPIEYVDNSKVSKEELATKLADTRCRRGDLQTGLKSVSVSDDPRNCDQHFPAFTHTHTVHTHDRILSALKSASTAAHIFHKPLLPRAQPIEEKRISLHAQALVAT